MCEQLFKKVIEELGQTLVSQEDGLIVCYQSNLQPMTSQGGHQKLKFIFRGFHRPCEVKQQMHENLGLIGLL